MIVHRDGWMDGWIKRWINWTKKALFYLLNLAVTVSLFVIFQILNPKVSVACVSSQLRAFSQLKFHDGKSMVDTFRPVQPLNGRLVYRSGGGMILASTSLLALALATALGLSQLN